MRKGWIVLLTAVLVVAFAAPAMADLKVTGFYRSKAMLSSFFDGSGGPSLRNSEVKQTNAYVEQRARIKFDVGTESARAVFHFESDMNWGVGSGNSYVSGDTGTNTAVSNGRNGGGALSADTVQLETKEIYVWFKVPDTSITGKIGMQTVNDHYAGIFSNGADMAGMFFNGKFEPVKWTLGWAKLYETNGGGGSGGYDASDDTTLYLGSVQFAPGKDMDLGINFYYLQDDSGRNAGGFGRLDPGQGVGVFGPLDGYTVKVYTPGVNFAMNAGIAKISAFAFYQFGTADKWDGSSFDIKAFMGDVRADLKLGPGNFFVEGFYISGDDQGPAQGEDYKSIITLGDYQRGDAGPKNDGTGGNSGFGRTNMYFLFGADSLNVSQCLIGCSGGELGDSFGNSGFGLWHVAAGYSQKFTEKLKGAVNVGYASAAKDNPAIGRDGKDIGTEFNARVDYTLSKGLDVSLVGAYLLAGDFVTKGQGDPALGPDLDDTYYMVYGKIGYSF